MSRNDAFISDLSFTHTVRRSSGCCILIAERSLDALPCDMGTVLRLGGAADHFGQACGGTCPVCSSLATDGIRLRNIRGLLARSTGSKCRLFAGVNRGCNVIYVSTTKGSGVGRGVLLLGSRGILMVTSNTTFNPRVGSVCHLVRRSGTGFDLCLPRSLR